MRTVTQGVEDQHLQPFQPAEGGFRDEADIGAIGKIPDAVAQHRHAAVQQRYRQHRDAGSAEGGLVDQADLQAGEAAGIIVLAEHIGEDPPDILHGLGHAVDRDAGFIQQGEAAQVVHPQDVIDMVVGVEHRIEPAHPGAEHLLAVVQGGVDEDLRLSDPHQHRRAQTLVFGILRAAYPAVAAGHRHPHRSAAA